MRYEQELVSTLLVSYWLRFIGTHGSGETHRDNGCVKTCIYHAVILRSAFRLSSRMKTNASMAILWGQCPSRTCGRQSAKNRVPAFQTSLAKPRPCGREILKWSNQGKVRRLPLRSKAAP